MDFDDSFDMTSISSHKIQRAMKHSLNRGLESISKTMKKVNSDKTIDLVLKKLEQAYGPSCSRQQGYAPLA